MLWTPDPVIDEARKLRDWKSFHEECGRNGLCFDIPGRDKKRGPFTVIAFHPKKTDHGGWVQVELCRASNRDLLVALKQAHDESGRGTAETGGMIETGLTGKPVEPDDYEGMLG